MIAFAENKYCMVCTDLQDQYHVLSIAVELNISFWFAQEMQFPVFL